PADVRDHDALTQALKDAATRFGGIDVLEHSPAPSIASVNLTSPSQTSPSDVQGWIDFLLNSAITATQAVLPAMREAGAGTLLFTNGAGSVDPIPMLGNVNPPRRRCATGRSTCTRSWPAPVSRPRTSPSACGSARAALPKSRPPRPRTSPLSTGTCTPSATKPSASSPADASQLSPVEA
ncbi:SDR family NAD(P)-dependent oxidoreductase, partial [Streptomyces spinoverrucosus]|uniref:SDR family NAD(P)-dependent oxidoreductase n=1 Tax=Streptomyces spinoverrucosus TaxID=284043 RepID=UPI001E2895DF